MSHPQSRNRSRRLPSRCIALGFLFQGNEKFRYRLRERRLMPNCDPFHSVPGRIGHDGDQQKRIAAMQSLPLLLTGAVALAGAALISFSSHAARSDDAVILASTVPGYIPGMVVAPGDPLRLPDGASATLLLQSGEMLRVRGPFEGSLAKVRAEQRQSASGLADAFRLTGADATVIGGTRTLMAVPDSFVSEDIVIDPRHSGTWCLPSQPSVWLTRPASDARSFALKRKRTVHPIAWPQGAERVEWPDELPIEDNDRYEVIVGGAEVATLTFHIMGSQPLTGAAPVAQGVALGCHEQFDAALHRLARTALAPDLWITSDHGRHPVLAAGEPIMVTVMAGSDGYLSCVSHAPDGKAVSLLPASADARSPSMAIGQRQDLPLVASSAGLMRIQCRLADTDGSEQRIEAGIPPAPGRLAMSGDAGSPRAATDELVIQVDRDGRGSGGL